MRPSARRFFTPAWTFMGIVVLSSLAVFFFETGRNREFESLWDAFWWAFVSVTTTGYGDKVPVSAGGRVAAVFAMTGGVVLLGLVTGGLASILVEKSLSRLKGLGKVRNMKGHFVICGWKKDMSKVLRDILRLHSSLKPSDLVVLAPVGEDEIQRIEEIKELEGVVVLRGDYHTEEDLDRAGIKKARKALVLADSSNDLSPNEVDARTVMTVMSIQKMSRDVYICAELLDRKYEHYLRMVKCDEILFTKEYSRMMLANAAVDVGISHVVASLLGLEGESFLATRRIPEDLVGVSFQELKEHFEGKGEIAIGILENTGVLRKLREAALREAQKSPDISDLVKKLKAVKEIKGNVPVINPGPDYRVPANSVAVVVRRPAVG